MTIIIFQPQSNILRQAMLKLVGMDSYALLVNETTTVLDSNVHGADCRKLSLVHWYPCG